MNNNFPIGVFDSGFGGLTILKEIVKTLPEYDYIYLGDNARTPYGNRSYEIVHQYTLEAVKWLFAQNCHLIIIACNTATAKALRTIQQKNLPSLAPKRRVLGIIRPLTERIDHYTTTKHIGILGTKGTVESGSYVKEINNFFPDIHVVQEACPMWVPLVENNESSSEGADYFVRKHLNNLLAMDPLIDTIVLGCTHYPLLIDKIRFFLPPEITIISQGSLVASSLRDYLARHAEIDILLTRSGQRSFFTSDTSSYFDNLAVNFFGEKIRSTQIQIA